MVDNPLRSKVEIGDILNVTLAIIGITLCITAIIYFVYYKGIVIP